MCQLLIYFIQIVFLIAISYLRYFLIQTASGLSISSKIVLTHSVPILSNGIVSVATAQNIVVIKSKPGFANTICVVLDQLELEGLVGTLAGDDTILIVFKTAEKAQSIESELKEVFGH